MNRCFEEAENFHSSFITQTEATQIHLNALQQVRHKKKNALNLNDNVFSTKGDTIFTSPSGDGTAILRGLLIHAKVSPLAVQRYYLHFSVILRPWVLIRPRESNPRPPALQSSLYRLSNPVAVTKGVQAANPAAVKKGVQVASESSLGVPVKPFLAQEYFLDFVNKIRWNLSNECITLDEVYIVFWRRFSHTFWTGLTS